MKPRTEKAGEACLDGTPLRTASKVIDTPIGPMLATASTEGLRTLWFGAGGVGAGRGDASAAGDDVRRVLEQTERELGEYFAGTRREFAVPRVVLGSGFQLDVWKRLERIEYGRTFAYGQLASELGDAGSARAVAAACGQNSIPIIVPCHRVIAADGTLWGFGGGLERKAFLLDLEAKVTGRYEPGLFG